MHATALPSGTVYPILRRLEAQGCVRSQWEPDGAARHEHRPPRRYYELTSQGRDVADEAASKYRALEDIARAPAKSTRSR
jgi:PadR family transcriptional regulator PadR